MGCLSSKSSSSKPKSSSSGYESVAEANQKKQLGPLQYTWSYLAQQEKNKKEIDFSLLKREDFLLSGFENTNIIRKPGYVPSSKISK